MAKRLKWHTHNLERVSWARLDQRLQPTFSGMALTSIAFVVVGNLTSTDLQMLKW